MRKAPSKSAAVLGSAAQGAVLTVIGYTSSGGGWFEVKGATVTGWITAQPTLSAPGEFQSFSSSEFAALYPASWTESDLPTPKREPTTSPLSGVVFRPPSGAGDILVLAGGTVSQLPHGRPGYGRYSVSDVVACGITAGLVVLQQSGPTPTTSSVTSVPESLTYLAEVRFAVDKKHAFGLYGDLADLGPSLQIFRDFVASMTFTAPQCVG